MSALETYLIITIQEMQTGLIKHLVRALLSPSNTNNSRVAHRNYSKSLFSFLNPQMCEMQFKLLLIQNLQKNLPYV